MAIVKEETISMSGSAVEEILELVRSEPALGWFLAQALWIAQPALEAFWPQERIAALAERLERGGESEAAEPAAVSRGEGR
ncbi:MAG: hypothetical protein JW929_04920 [Anaerolineales bacterium]|nr:hypothetical protein [Anaerolineales bacterium]